MPKKMEDHKTTVEYDKKNSHERNKTGQNIPKGLSRSADSNNHPGRNIGFYQT